MPSTLGGHNIRSTGTGVIDHWEAPCGCWKWNSGPLEDQLVPWTAEPSLQPPPYILKGRDRAPTFHFCFHEAGKALAKPSLHLDHKYLMGIFTDQYQVNQEYNEYLWDKYQYHSRSKKQGSLRLEEAMWRPEMRLVRKTCFQGAAELLSRHTIECTERNTGQAKWKPWWLRVRCCYRRNEINPGNS